ncbi:MAG: hypothetical protein NTZ09_01140 [Candidatus Hydrogenedentes bacterium]|nr:hypothetical protein [Candidatus Hydrogenedentota bacterium]
MTIQKSCLVFLSVAFVMLGASPASADEATEKQYVFNIAIYQILTNVTGNGLTSRTLPGVEGWVQVIHEKLDNVELVMEGDAITWNGQPKPDNPRIMSLAKPNIITQEGERANMVVGDEFVQYMTRREDGLFELHTTTSPDQEFQPLRLQLSLLPAPSDRPGIINCDLKFHYNWIKDRERIEGVGLPVGKPVIADVGTSGNVMMELGKWSCLQLSADSEGHIYVFIKATLQ